VDTREGSDYSVTAMRTTAQGWVPRLAALLALMAGCLGPGLAAARYLPQERVPTNSPIYRDIERLMSTYDRSPQALSMRPLRVQELRSYLNSLIVEHPSAASDPSMIRARRFVDRNAPGARHPFITIQDDTNEVATISPYASLSYEEDPRNRPDLNRDYRIGVQVAAAFDSTTIVVFDGYEGTASQGGRGTPDFGRLNAAIEGVDLNSWMDEAYAEMKLAGTRLLIGHTYLRWGPGRMGTLALSDNAPALDLIRIEGGFRHKWRAQSFVAVLDPGPQTYLAGHRIEWTFRPGLKLGLTELARFDGTSQGLLYFIPVVPYSFWEKRPKSEPPGAVPGDTTGYALSKNNVLTSVDLSWIPRPGYRLWGEFLIDDISFSRDYKPDLIGWQAGVEERWVLGSASAEPLKLDAAAAAAPEGEPGPTGVETANAAEAAAASREVKAGGTSRRAITLAIEYNRVNNYVYSAWHGHHFEYRGYPLGFLDGPDVMHVAAEVAYEHGASWELRVRGELRRKGEGFIGNAWFREMGKVDAGAMSGIVERDARVAAQVIYNPGSWLRLDASVGYASFKNEDHLDVGVEDEVPFRLAARLQW